MAVPKRVHKRIADGTRKYRKILDHAKTRDVNEADTVTIVKAILADVFGWNPFFELTSEYQVRGTYVDLAVKVGDRGRIQPPRKPPPTGGGVCGPTRHGLGCSYERSHVASI